MTALRPQLEHLLDLLTVARVHWRPLAVCTGIGYLLLVRTLRFRVRDRVLARFAHRGSGRDWRRDMTPAEAQEIVHASAVWDMRTLLSYALSFAIIRTYAIPSISKILLSSRELSSGPQVSKRFLDTAIVVGAWHACPISVTDPPSTLYTSRAGPNPPTSASEDPRAFVGIARMNWLHAHYAISNDDYLYTLALFVLQPIAWARAFAWRALEPVEAHAWLVFYTRIGEMMGIRSIPESLNELAAWAEDYERTYMVPADSNALLADGMLTELTSSKLLPAPVKKFLRGCITVMFPERMRVAMKLPEPTRAQRFFAYTLLYVSAFVQRYLLLPRINPPPQLVALRAPEPRSDGQPARMHPGWPSSKPWYIARPRGLALLREKVLLGLGIVSKDSVPGPQYLSEGFRMEEIGPLKWRNAGHEKVFADAEALMGCPMSGIWARPLPPATEKSAESTVGNQS